MTTHDTVQERLSDYLDGELTSDERAEVEAHLAGCARCSDVVAELKHVVALAGSLQPQAPAHDLWGGISSGLKASGPVLSRRRISFTIPELAAASVLLAMLSGGAVAVIVQRSPADVVRDAAAGAASPSQAAGIGVLAQVEDSAAIDADIVNAVSFADEQFDAAVSDLERALESGRGRLDPETVLVVEENLSIIDRAIAEARRALVSDPSNGYLSGHLMEARRRKLHLLRRATALSETN